jgi:hypothetical protein
MSEGGVVVEADLGVERVDLSVGRQDQRIDLDQIGIAIDEAPVKLPQNVDCTWLCFVVQPRSVDELTGLSLREPLNGIDVQASDRVRILGCDLFDVDAASRRNHAEVLPRATIERERGVILTLDV